MTDFYVSSLPKQCQCRKTEMHGAKFAFLLPIRARKNRLSLAALLSGLPVPGDLEECIVQFSFLESPGFHVKFNLIIRLSHCHSQKRALEIHRL